MRSKRSRAWHLRKETRMVREMIEQGVNSQADSENEEEKFYAAYVHSEMEADLRGLVRVPK